MPLSQSEVFREVYNDLTFPFLSVDLCKLRHALVRTRGEDRRSSMFFVISAPSEKRDAFVSSLRGLLRKIEVPPDVARFIATSTPLISADVSDEMLSMIRGDSAFVITEVDGRLKWEEDSLWPIAYSTCLEQFLQVVALHKKAIEQNIQKMATATEGKGYSADGFNMLSEYPRQHATRFHYAAASLGAWLGGAQNVQYFACFATLRQITHPSLNIQYAERIGYDAATARQLNDSGIIALPASLVVPLVEAQGSAYFGSIAVDELNLANMPTGTMNDWENSAKQSNLTGLITDKYYRAPFRARHLAKRAAYGSKDVLRDHYTDFYAGLVPESFVRCKHYCVPVVEVRSLEEIRAYISKIPIRNAQGLFFRGQSYLRPLNRDPKVREFLFGDSCSTEPSLITSAARDPNYDYELVHFALRFFLEKNVIDRADVGSKSNLDEWQKLSVSPICKLDSAIMALCQHYGLPSHGLDVTLSDEVALWFATNRFAPGEDGKAASYKKLQKADWPTDRSKWPVFIACQMVTHSIGQSLHDCHELEAFGFQARRPAAQRARFFQGGHSDHQNRLAEAVVCVFRLAPGDYETVCTFESLFPSPEEDPAYQILLKFASDPRLGGVWGRRVNRFH